MSNKILFLILLFFLEGCGYQIAQNMDHLSLNYKKIAILLFINKTEEPGIEQEVSKQIQERFIHNGRLKIVSEKQAELILKGEITHYRVKPISFDSRDQVTEYNVEMDIAIKLSQPDEKIILMEQSLSTKWDYKAEQNISLSEVFRYKAISLASKDFAERLVSIIVDGF